MKYYIPSPAIILLPLLLAVATQVGCKNNQTDITAGAVAVDETPPAPKVPQDLNISVEIDGVVSESITAARLEALTPDVDGGSGKGWFLSRFLGEGYRRGRAVVEIEGGDGVSVRFPRAVIRKDLKEPTLVLNKQGEIVVALVAPQDLSGEATDDALQGRGGNPGRGGDLDIRVRDIQVIRLLINQERGQNRGRQAKGNVAGGMSVVGNSSPPRGDGRGSGGAQQRGQQMATSVRPGQVATAMGNQMPVEQNIPKENPPIKVIVDGARDETWTFENLQDVKMLNFGVDERAQAREGWSLRELLAARFGQAARITHMLGDKDRRYDMDAALWDNAETLPTLRLNRRKSWKLQWVRAADLGPFKAKELRGVKEIHVVTAPKVDKSGTVAPKTHPKTQ